MPSAAPTCASPVHGTHCTCADLLSGPDLGRRRFLALSLAAGGAAALAMTPGIGLAASGTYQAMLLSCIDPRLVSRVHDYMGGRNLHGQYSQFVIAGGPLGVVAPAFADWRKAFWDNLAASIEMHSIKKVVALSHRDCGAAKMVYGPTTVDTREKETATHRDFHAAFRAEVAKRHPALAVETGIMALDGGVEMVA